jgi:ferredoxin
VTRSVLIVGSGPAAVGAALAATRHADVRIGVLDIGGQLEVDNDMARARLALAPRSDWNPQDVAAVSRLPEASVAKGLPEKRSYGSDYPFRDLGQRAGLAATGGINDALISGAYGGFSNAWGAQFMPFTAETLRQWPIDVDDMHDHYAQILREIPLAAEQDDLAELFPTLKTDASPLPRLSQRSDLVLARYERHRARLNGRGLTLGRARLAIKADECIRCGLCMTGCPYSLIYSASHTMDRLRKDSKLEYHAGLLAVKVDEDDYGATVTTIDTKTGRQQSFTADRVLLACGAIGTSRLVLSSLNQFDVSVDVLESSQFRLPFASMRPTADPRQCDDFTLNQFNLAVEHDAGEVNVSQLHFYTYNPAFVDALPDGLKGRGAGPVRRELLKRLSVALGYLPSWVSPRFRLQVHRPDNQRALAGMTLQPSGGYPGLTHNALFRDLVRRVTSAAPYLDLWPVLPALKFAAEGKSYHWGGTFPHVQERSGQFESDTLGRVLPWERIHLVDSAVFPTVPATTFALTVMANAHRIADVALGELD